MYTRDAVITVLPFTQHPDAGEVIIGRAETGVFLAVPPEAVEVLNELSLGRSIGAVSDSYLQKYGEAPDLNDFLELLEAKGMIKPGRNLLNAEEPDISQPSSTQKIRYHFATFPQTVAQRIFSKPVLILSLTVVLCTIALCVKSPSLLPTVNDLYFPDYRGLSWLLLFAASYATLFLHEFAHLLAARALGVNSRIGISHRLWYLVAETDLTGLWSVPKKKRYVPMLAGSILDITSGCLILLAVYINHNSFNFFPVIIIRLMRAMAFTYAMRLAWQFLFYLRTDFYYIFAAIFNCKSLMRDTEAFLSNLLSKFSPRIKTVDQSTIPPSERCVIRYYAVLWVAGRLGAVALLCAVTIPLGIRYIRSLLAAFKIGFAANPLNFLDNSVVAAYFLIPTLIGFALWFRSIVQQERTQ